MATLHCLSPCSFPPPQSTPYCCNSQKFVKVFFGGGGQTGSILERKNRQTWQIIPDQHRVHETEHMVTPHWTYSTQWQNRTQTIQLHDMFRSPCWLCCLLLGPHIVSHRPLHDMSRHVRSMQCIKSSMLSVGRKNHPDIAVLTQTDTVGLCKHALLLLFFSCTCTHAFLYHHFHYPILPLNMFFFVCDLSQMQKKREIYTADLKSASKIMYGTQKIFSSNQSQLKTKKNATGEIRGCTCLHVDVIYHVWPYPTELLFFL